MPPTEPTEIQRPSCPYCGHGKAWRNGRRNGQQRWLCKNCGREHVALGLSNPLNRAEPYLLLAVAGEKQEERLVGAQNGTKEGGEMEECQSLNQSGLLKSFPEGLRAKILQFAVQRENQGLKDTKHIFDALHNLAKNGADLYDPESVKATLVRMKIDEGSKRAYALRYEAFLKFLGGKWERPNYKQRRKIPFIPTEQEIDQLIAGLSLALSVLCQILKETGARVGEALRLKWTDIDFERHLITINDPEKGSDPRIIRVSEKCIGMVNRLPRRGEKLFKFMAVKENFHRQRMRIAYQLNNPRMLKIRLHTFRHWHATMEYHKTKDIIHVQKRLGHKRIENTMIYITIEQTIFQEANDEFICRVTSSKEEAIKLVEVGFDYVATFNGEMYFKKRK